MTKNRKISYCRGPQMKKKKIEVVDLNANQGPSILNDGILGMYRKEVQKTVQERMIKINASESKREESYKKSLKKDEKNEGVLLQLPSSKIETPKTTSKTPKKKKDIVAVKNPTVTITDIGGLKQEIACILDMCLHLKYPLKSGVHLDRGLLLHGPPGCGKTLLANAIANFIKVPFIEVQITSLVNQDLSDTNNLKEFFEKAVRYAPCLLFIDQIDAISGKRDNSDRNTERRMVTQLMQCFDDLNAKDPMSQVMVIGSTNRIDAIDPALRRGGRFDHEIALTMPDEDGRLKILQILCKDLQLSEDCELNFLAQITPGFSGADLHSVVSGATKHARHRFFRGLAHKNNNICDVTKEVKFDSDFLSAEEVMSWFQSDFKMEDECSLIYDLQDFEKSIKNYIPCSKREGYPTVPNVTWNDVGALKEARDVIESSVLWPVKHKKLYDLHDMQSATGILLCGPKGCGKTLLAKAIANEAGINFLSVKGPELLNMYLGESEKSVRQCFLRARNAAPCLIFFDEIDALCSSRSSSNINAASDRVVTQLLTEMEGVEDRKQVFVMAATNRPEKIDSAMLRPGRLDQVIFVDVPTDLERVDILKSLTRNKTRPKITESLDLETIALDQRCSGFSGADLSYLVKEAFRCSLKDYITKNQDSETNEALEICFQHIEKAFTVVKPSVSEHERESLKRNFQSMKK